MAEQDTVICVFYLKTGACPRGYRCSRLHTRPSMSRTLLLSNMYQLPVDDHGNPIDPRKMQQHYEDFYEGIFKELRRYGEIESLNICENRAAHLAGNVYVVFGEQLQARNALRNLEGSFYAGRPVIVDFSPVTDLREGICSMYEQKTCYRGERCNFMHLKSISKELREQLYLN